MENRMEKQRSQNVTKQYSHESVILCRSVMSDSGKLQPSAYVFIIKMSRVYNPSGTGSSKWPSPLLDFYKYVLK